MAKVLALTTVDNPFDFFNDFENWWDFDRAHEYQCMEKVAKVAAIKPGMSHEEENLAYNKAVHQVIDNDILGIYRIVSMEDDFYDLNKG